MFRSFTNQRTSRPSATLASLNRRPACFLFFPASAPDAVFAVRFGNAGLTQTEAYSWRRDITATVDNRRDQPGRVPAFLPNPSGLCVIQGMAFGAIRAIPELTADWSADPFANQSCEHGDAARYNASGPQGQQPGRCRRSPGTSRRRRGQRHAQRQLSGFDALQHQRTLPGKRAMVPQAGSQPVQFRPASLLTVASPAFPRSCDRARGALRSTPAPAIRPIRPGRTQRAGFF